MNVADDLLGHLLHHSSDKSMEEITEKRQKIPSAEAKGDLGSISSSAADSIYIFS